MSLKLHTAAVMPAVSLADARLHMHVDGTDEDTLITAMINAATLDAEHLMGRAVMPQKWQLTLDSLTNSIDLSMPPVTGIDSITYLTTSGAATVLPPEVYQLVNGSDYTASVVLDYQQAWPAVRVQREAVKVVFSCGYADAASVPEPITAWIKLRATALFKSREGWTMGQAIEQNQHLDFMLDRYRTWVL